MDARLSDHAYLAGDYSIADMAAYPWLRAHSWQGQKLDDYPGIQRWYNAVRERPAVQRGLAVLGERLQTNKSPPTGKAWENLFGSNQFSVEPSSHRDRGAEKSTER